MSTTTTSTTLPVETGVWRAIPAGPLSPRVLALAVWTGEELVVVGGYDDDPCLLTRESDGAGGGSGSRSAVYCFAIKSVVTDGAAFDPEAGRWRQITTPPVPLTRSTASAVAHGGIVYILMGPQPGAFLAYHPADDRWEHLPPPATRGTLVEAGDRLALFKYQDPEGDTDLWFDGTDQEVAPDLLFDPETKEWFEIPPDPLIPSWDRSMVWTGTELVLLGVKLAPYPSSAPSLYRAAVFDPGKGTWRLLPDSNLVITGGNRTWYFADGRLINPSLGSSDGGDTNPYDRAYPQGGILDVETGEWLPLPDPPANPYIPGTFIGYAAGSPSRYLSGYGWLFDPVTGQWESLPAPPDNSSIPVPRNGSAVLFAGPDLVVWGGFLYGDDGRGEMVSTGWMWRPGG